MEAPKSLAGYDPHETAGDCWFDEDAALKAIEFFPRYLVHIKGPLAGKPYELNPWERDVTAAIFGWKRQNGTRRYREAFIFVARKNSKTTWCAGLALYGLMCDGEEGAEVYCCAGDKDQATLVFAPALANVRKNDALARRCKIREAEKRIVYNGTSILRAIPADAAGAHGFNAHIAIMDELHTQPNRDLYDVMRTSQGTRVQPLMVSITTAGHDRTSICYELYEHACKVRDGVINDPYFLPVIYEIAPDDDWTDPKVWKKANPNLGRSVSVEFLEESCKRAKLTPAYENTFKNLHLNVWTESVERWIPSEQWKACIGELPDFTNEACYAGLDLASTDDLTALVYLFPDIDGKAWVLPRFWCPEETIRTAPKRFQRQYQRWFDAGLITPTPGNATDYAFVRKQIEDDAEKFHIKAIGFDAWQALDTYNYLTHQGFECVKVPQSFGGMWPGTKWVEEAVLDNRLRHDGNEVLSWMMDCTYCDRDAHGNRKPSKKQSHGADGMKGKIDGIAALVMAAGVSLADEPNELGTYYEKNDVEVF